MNAFLKCRLILILLADALVLLVLVASLIFGFSFGVRIGDTNHFRELSRMEFITILGTTVVVAIFSLVLLARWDGKRVNDLQR